MGRDHAVRPRCPGSGSGARAQQVESCEAPGETHLPACLCALSPNDFRTSFKHALNFILTSWNKLITSSPVPKMKRKMSSRHGTPRRREDVLQSASRPNLRTNQWLFCALDKNQLPFHPLMSKAPLLHGSDFRA